MQLFSLVHEVHNAPRRDPPMREDSEVDLMSLRNVFHVFPDFEWQNHRALIQIPYITETYSSKFYSFRSRNEMEPSLN